MRRLSLFKLIKKIRNYSHVSIFFNNRLDKPIRYGYRYVQRAFREPKRLKFLKIQVRQPRLPVKRKTRYGKRLQLRQKAIYMLNFGRLKRLVAYNNSFNRAGKFSRFSNFSALNFFLPNVYLHTFGFVESPAFNFFTSRFMNRFININSPSNVFANLSYGEFRFPLSGYFFLYVLRTFFYRLFVKPLRFFSKKYPFFFSTKLFTFYPFKPTFYYSGAFRKSFDFKFTQFSFGRLRLRFFFILFVFIILG